MAKMGGRLTITAICETKGSKPRPGQYPSAQSKVYEDMFKVENVYVNG